MATSKVDYNTLFNTARSMLLGNRTTYPKTRNIMSTVVRSLNPEEVPGYKWERTVVNKDGNTLTKTVDVNKRNPLVELRRKINDIMKSRHLTYYVFNIEEQGISGLSYVKRVGKLVDYVDDDTMLSLAISPDNVNTDLQLYDAIFEGTRDALKRLLKKHPSGGYVFYQYMYLTGSVSTDSPLEQMNGIVKLSSDRKTFINSVIALTDQILDDIESYEQKYEGSEIPDFNIGDVIINFRLDYVAPTNVYGRGEFEKMDILDIFCRYNPENDGDCLFECVYKCVDKLTYNLSYRKVDCIYPYYFIDNNRFCSLSKFLEWARSDYRTELNQETEKRVITQLAKIFGLNIVVFEWSLANDIDQNKPDIWHYARVDSIYMQVKEVNIYQGDFKPPIVGSFHDAIDEDLYTFYLIRITNGENAHYIVTDKSILLDRKIINGQIYKGKKIIPQDEFVTCACCGSRKLPTTDEERKLVKKSHTCCAEKGCYPFGQAPSVWNNKHNIKTPNPTKYSCKYSKHICKCRRCNQPYVDEENLFNHQCHAKPKALTRVSHDECDTMLIPFDIETFVDNREVNKIVSCICTGGRSKYFSNWDITYDQENDSSGRKYIMPDDYTSDESVSKCTYLFIKKIVDICHQFPNYPECPNERGIAETGTKILKHFPNNVYFIAHNGARFDTAIIFSTIACNIQNWFHDERFRVDYMLDGKKIKSLTLNIPVLHMMKKIHFRDSYAYIPFSLKKLPDIFDFDYKKGDFDYEKNTIEKFSENKEELLAYCRRDCEVLYQALRKVNSFFQYACNKSVRKDVKFPFIYKSVSNAGVAKMIYDKVYPGQEKICWQDHNFDNSRCVANTIQTHLKRMFNVDNLYVSCCDVEGCSICKEPKEIIRRYPNYLLIDFLKKKLNNPKLITSVYDKDYFVSDGNYLIPQCIAEKYIFNHEFEVKPIRDAFFGGRSECIKNYHKSEKGNIRVLDINSSYASILNSDVLIPIGRDIYIDKDFENHNGLLCVDLLPPKNLKIPYVRLKLNTKVYWSLCQTCTEEHYNYDGQCKHTEKERVFKQYMITNTRLKKALSLGYKVLKYHYMIGNTKWVMAKDVFGNMLDRFNKIKVMTRWNETYSEDHPEIKIKPSERNLIGNKAFELLSKQMGSALWGNFAKRPIVKEHKIVEKRDIMLFVTSGRYEKIEGYVIPNSDKRILILKNKNPNNPKDTNYHLSIFITDAAEQRLYEMMENVGYDALLYVDTDSVIFDKSLVKNIQFINNNTSTRLGDWKIEKDNIVEFCCIASKTYSMEDIDGNIYVKAKGLTFKNEDDKITSFCGEIDPKEYINRWRPSNLVNVMTNNLFFGSPLVGLSVPELYTVSRNLFTVKSTTLTKSIRDIEKKRHINEDLTTIPFGYV